VLAIKPTKVLAMEKKYTSPRPVFVGGAYYSPGSTFVTDATPSHDWLENGREKLTLPETEITKQIDARNRIENPKSGYAPIGKKAK
jgi:hypothetical protein